MIKFSDSSGELHPLENIFDFYLLHKTDGSIRLCFSIEKEHPFYNEIVEECELEYGDNLYLVKKVKNGDVECDLNFDFLRRKIYKAFSSGSKTLSEVLYAHLPAGWTVVNDTATTIRRTISFDFATDYDIVMATMSTYGIYLEWKIKQKTVTVILPDDSDITGEYVTDQLNLRKLSMQGDSLSFITRLYAYGKEGLTFADINEDKEYVDNFSYSKKIVCGYWSDERYTVVEELLEAAKEKLKTLSYPVRSYECDIVDLAKMNPKYSFLQFKLHKSVMLLDREHGIKVKHRIVQYKEYPNEPNRNVVTLSSVPPTISTTVNNVVSQITEQNKSAMTEMQQSSLALSELISNAMGVYFTKLQSDNGSIEYYLHDQPTLENSTTIYTHNSGGYAFTNSGWNNGNPTWEYGITKAGNAIFNKICAYGIEVSDLTSKNSAHIAPGVFSVKYGDMEILSINGDESRFNKIKSEQFECGNVRARPHIVDGKVLGCNIIYADA